MTKTIKAVRSLFVHPQSTEGAAVAGGGFTPLPLISSRIMTLEPTYKIGVPRPASRRRWKWAMIEVERVGLSVKC